MIFLQPIPQASRWWERKVTSDSEDESSQKEEKPVGELGRKQWEEQRPSMICACTGVIMICSIFIVLIMIIF